MSDKCCHLVLHRVGVRLDLIAGRRGGELIQISLFLWACSDRLVGMGVRRALSLIISGLLVAVGHEEGLSARGCCSLVLQKLF